MSFLMAGLSFLTFKSEAQSSWDFQFGYLDVFSPNALNYVVQEQNIQTTSEGGNPADGVSYWNPINNGTPATFTQEFTFPGQTTAISLFATIATYNFGGSEFGSGSLWASTDDVNWVLLENAPTPPYPGYSYGWASTYDAELPSSLLGANQIYIQTQLNTSGFNIMAQFGRQDTSVDNGLGYLDGANIFELDANYTTVPENSTMSLSGIGLAILVFTSKGLKRPLAQ